MIGGYAISDMVALIWVHAAIYLVPGLIFTARIMWTDYVELEAKRESRRPRRQHTGLLRPFPV